MKLFTWELLMLLASGLMLAVAAQANAEEVKHDRYNVSSYGAKGDGRAKDTQAIQAAIDACRRHGGGTVYLPPGTYLSGSLHLQNGVGLHLDHGATLLASKSKEDFDPYERLGFKNDADQETSFFHHALVWAEDVERIAITGTGTIDGNRDRRGGPKMIALKRCKHVTIKELTLNHAPNYAISLLGTDYVNIDGVTILDAFSDGIDPDCCHYVRISNCHIESWDDAIVPKTSFSLGYRRSTENVTVSNCILATNCNAFKLGTESGGDFKQIAVSNCIMFQRPQMRPPQGGIALLSVDGSTIDGVTVSNIVMTNVRVPIFLRLGNRGRDMATPTPGTWKNVTVSQIVASGAESGCAIAGIPGHCVEGVTLSNIRVACKGGGKREQTKKDVPEQIDKYPRADMFGVLPAYGLYCRHVSGLKLLNVQVTCAEPDLRHALVCDDVSNLIIESLETEAALGSEPVIRFRQVRDALIRGCVPGKGTDVFLEITDRGSNGITLTANDFRSANKPFRLGKDVPKESVGEVGNRR